MTNTNISTLGDLQHDYILHVHCKTSLCFHNAPLDVDALRELLGDDFPESELAGRCRCTKCNRRNAMTTKRPVRTGPQL